MEDALKNGFHDAYILDVMMPGMDGIHLGHALRDMGFKGIILYLTSSEEYAIDAFKVKAYNYILKPIEKENFFLALDDVLAIPSEPESTQIIIKAKNGGNIKIQRENIIYVTLDKRAASYHFANGQTISGRTIRVPFREAMHDLLQNPAFVMCGASTVINLQHIRLVEHSTVFFQNDSCLFIPKRADKKLISDWQNYLSGSYSG